MSATQDCCDETITNPTFAFVARALRLRDRPQTATHVVIRVSAGLHSRGNRGLSGRRAVHPDRPTPRGITDARDRVPGAPTDTRRHRRVRCMEGRQHDGRCPHAPAPAGDTAALALRYF